MNRSKSERVADSIAEKVLDGTYRIGELLPGENELANQLEVSRTSIRSALKTLSSKGILSIIPKKGSEVNPTERWNWLDSDVLNWITDMKVDQAFIKQLMVTRLIFEPNIAALAAQNATAKDLARLEAGYEEMELGFKTNNRALFNQGDIKFHRGLLASSHNPFLIALGDVMASAMMISFDNSLEDDVALSEPALKEHFELMNHVRFRNISKAKSLSRKIVLEALGKIVDDPESVVEII